MRLTELLKLENIKLGLAARAKQAAIEELVGLLAASGAVPNAAAALAVVLERESTRSTGIGNGTAIPHGKLVGIDHLAMALGRCSEPVDFGSIDGRPVTWIWLLVSPAASTQHIPALARISKLMLIDKFRRDMLSATTPQRVLEIITEHEAAT
jgi:mannitol/fructose-specific phosphotransferase system IIA component (Ntr-type)